MTTKKPYYPILEAKIAENGIAKVEIASMLRITPRSLSLKLSGKTDLKLTESLKIWKLFSDISVEKLFSHESDSEPS